MLVPTQYKKVENIIKYYDTYKTPEQLIKGFRCEFEFMVWLRINKLKYIMYILQCFENEELYEYCTSIQKVIDEKLNQKIRTNKKI